MLSEPPACAKEVEDYEARMFDYFSQCSIKLRDWYNNGGKDSEAYGAEYNRVSEEYQQYLSYIRELRDLVAKSSEQNEVHKAVAPGPALLRGHADDEDSEATTVFMHRPKYNATAAIVAYTQYYQELISYFDQLLKTLESVPQETPQFPEASGEPVADDFEETENLEDIEAAVEVEDTLDVGCDPRAVMKQYFQRFGETGKWDWASWNNYLSWIARSNPQWYAIFLEYSQSLGIDWDQMYNLWKTSDPSAKSSFEDGIANLVGPNFIKPPSLNQSVYHGLLFGNTTSAESDDHIGDELYCHTCQRQFPTERVFTLHLRGVTHIQRALEGLQRANPERLDRYAFFPTQDTGAARHYTWVQSQYLQKSQSEFVHPGSFYCELCQVRSASHTSLQAHLNGRRHRNNVALLHAKGPSEGNVAPDKPAKPKSLARLQTLLDVCTQPLIGLNYIVERQFGDEEECAYFCDLCNERTTRQDTIKHVCDVPHRTNYMKSHYPDMCGIIVNDCSDPSVRLKRIEFYARKIEDFEGRKRVKVKKLSAFDALRRLWRSGEESEVKEPVGAQKLKSLNKITPVPKKIVKKPPKVKPKSDSADLEEGEITEESSDEEAAVDTKFAEQAEAPVNGEHIEEVPPCDEPQLSLDELIPRAVSAFRPTADCEVYIKTLKSSGALDLDKQPPEAQGALKSSGPDSFFTDKFELEAQWVLDRVRARQAEEEEQRRQYALSLSEAAKQKAAEVSDEEHPIPIDEEQSTYEGKLQDIDERVLPERRSPVRLSAPFVSASNSVPAAEKSPEKAPIPESTIVGLLSSVDRKGQNATMSNGAVEIIMSALDALRDAGQLPTSVLSGLQQPASTVSTSTASAPSTTMTSVSAGRTPVKRTPKRRRRKASKPNTQPSQSPVISNQPQLPKPIPVSKIPQHIKPVQFSIRPKPPASKVLVEITPSYFDRSTTGNSDSSPNSEPPSDHVQAKASGPDENAVRPTDRGPRMGLLGSPNLKAVTQSPSPHRFPAPVPAPTTKPPRPALNSLTEPPGHFAKTPDSNTSLPKSDLSSPIMLTRSKAQAENFPRFATPPDKNVRAPPPPLRFASYMQLPENGSQDPMFDAYALYSRRADERSRSRHAKFDSQPKLPPRAGRNVNQPGIGRKLSVIADMLGVNEPPAPPRPPPARSPQHELNPSSLSSERSYLVPSEQLSNLSYYVPKDRTDNPPGVGPFTPNAPQHPVRFNLTQLPHPAVPVGNRFPFNRGGVMRR